MSRPGCYFPLLQGDIVADIGCVYPEYAQVTKMLGNGRLEAQCFDGEKRLAHIRGKMRKKV